MKKLMIGMLAAGAAIASAWAEGESTSTFSDVDFNDLGTFTVAAPWTYSDTVGDGELTITTGGATDDGKFLGLNTASKKLSLAPNADGTAYAVASEVYFDSYVKFDAASDTIPAVSGTDKLALFVLDNTDYVESGATTALYVLGGFWNSNAIEKRLYRLDTDVSTLTDFKHVSIKMYKNVLKTGSAPGFVIKVGDTVAQVADAFPIAADGSVNFAEQGAFSADYLGAEIDDAVAATRYSATSHQLILGLQETVGTTTLSAVDFMGKGGIDDLAFGTTDVGFGADASIYLVPEIDGVTVTCGNRIEDGKITLNDGESSLTFSVTLGAGYYYLLDGVLKKPGDTFDLTVSVANGGTLANELTADNVFPPVAIVGTTAYKTAALFATDAANGLSGNIKLLDDVDVGASNMISVNGEATLDLNGKTLTTYGVAASAALTINDSVGTGKIVGIVGGTITINAGTFDGAVTAASIPVSSTAKFLKTANTAEALVAMLTGQENGYEYSFADSDSDNYLTIVATAASNNDVVVDGEISTGDQATADANVAEIEKQLAANEATEDAKAWVTKIYGDKGVPAAALVGAKNIDISVKFDLPLMQNDPVITVEASTVETPAEGQPENVAAFEFTITDGEDGAELKPATVAKILDMVQYVESLTGTWAGAGTADVDTKLNGNKIKVQLKKKEGKNCGFMKLKLK